MWAVGIFMVISAVVVVVLRATLTGIQAVTEAAWSGRYPGSQPTG